MQVEIRDAYGQTGLVKKVFLKSVNFDVFFFLKKYFLKLQHHSWLLFWEGDLFKFRVGLRIIYFLRVGECTLLSLEFRKTPLLC